MEHSDEIEAESKQTSHDTEIAETQSGNDKTFTRSRRSRRGPPHYLKQEPEALAPVQAVSRRTRLAFAEREGQEIANSQPDTRPKKTSETVKSSSDHSSREESSKSARKGSKVASTKANPKPKSKNGLKSTSDDQSKKVTNKKDQVYVSEDEDEGSGPEDFGDGDDSDFQASDDEKEEKPTKHRKSTRSTRSNPQGELLVLSEDEEGEAVVKKASSKSKRKLGHEESQDDVLDEQAVEVFEQRRAKNKASKPKSLPQLIPRGLEDGPLAEDVLSSIPDADLPAPTNKKPNFFAMMASQGSRPPPDPNFQIPEASDNCLAGLVFVFTGVMPNLDRDLAKSVVQRYGGRVTSAISGKTSCVVLGDEAGPSKIQQIRTKGIKAITEEGFLELLRKMPANGGGTEAAQKALWKQQEEQNKIKEQISEIQAEVNEHYGDQGNFEMWTTKYAPRKLEHLAGNKGVIEKLDYWLHEWQSSLKSNFRKAGTHGLGGFRSVIISGPPGIGKTTAAHLAANLNGYDVLENNASDTRSKITLLENVTGTLTNESLRGFMGGNDKFKRHICLIMDEVDGLSSGDRGGVGQMAALCKTTEVPIILICNDRTNIKMRPFDRVAYDLPFRRPDANALRPRIMAIAKGEGIDISAGVSDQLVAIANSDVRQIINLLYIFSLTQKDLSYDNAKLMGQKSMSLKPFDIVGRLLSGATFAENSRIDLDEKLRYYFDEHDLTPLMVHENYLNCMPSSVKNGKFATRLDAIAAAADAIADGDLVDRNIRGTQPKWSLMPLHGILSSILPCSYAAGQSLGRYNFTGLLGQQSKVNKNARLLQELYAHMRLAISADHNELRLEYLPQLLDYKLINPLLKKKEKGIAEVMDLMDDYHLTKDDWTVAMDLTVGPKNYGEKAKGFSTGLKSSFTRNYNKTDHLMPFMKSASMFTAKATAATLPEEIPDLEETIGEELEDQDGDAAEDDNGDVGKDKYVKETTKKPSIPKKRKRKVEHY